MSDERTYSRAELEEVAGLAAGATAAVFMREVPQLVMPSGEISEAVGRALAAFDEQRPRITIDKMGPTRDLVTGERIPDDDPRARWMEEVARGVTEGATFEGASDGEAGE